MGKQDDARIAALVKKNSAKQPKKPKDPSQFDDTLRIRSEDQGPDAQFAALVPVLLRMARRRREHLRHLVHHGVLA